MNQPAPTPATPGRSSSSEAQLRRQLLEARSKLEGSAEDPLKRLAFAEACFRLAVLPGTDVDTAIAWLYEAADRDPYHPKLFFHLGRLLHKCGNPLGAVFEYRRALGLAPSSHRTYVHLALALSELEGEDRSLGLRILGCLANGADAELPAVLARLDALIQARLEPPRDMSKPTPERKAGGERNAGETSTRTCRWSGLWKLLLFDELSRARPRKKKLASELAAGKPDERNGNGAADYVVALLFFLFDSPKTHREIRRYLLDAKLDDSVDGPALQVLRSAVRLAEAEGAEEFVDRAVELIREGTLPLELVCALHFSWYGSSTRISVAEALTTLARYPAELRSEPCFRELQIAILDHYAKRDWAEERLDRAEILWLESLALDRFRISAAHNLAVCATRRGIPGAYSRYWERATELRYLQAAAAGDVRLHLEERRTQHRAFAQQARIRHCPPRADKKSDGPSDEELEAWIQDRDALKAWLLEWDLYYLNSRLKFHSAVHLLGVPRDCSDEDAKVARDLLLQQIGICFGKRDWAGIRAFQELASELVAAACDQARDVIARKRDPYYAAEKPEADRLLEDSIERGFLLYRMLQIAGKKDDSEVGRTVFDIARALLTMPWRALERHCRKNGRIPADIDLVPMFVSHLIGFVQGDRFAAGKPEHLEPKLEALEHCVTACPKSVQLRLVICALLLRAERNPAAYEAGLRGLPLLDTILDREEAARQEQNLVNCIDNAAFGELPESLRRPTDAEEAGRTVKRGLEILISFPKACGFRTFLVNLLLQLGEQHRANLDTAVELLEEGLELALTDEQLRELQRLQKRAGARSRSIAAVQEIRALLESAAARARDALELIKDARAPSTVRRALQELDLAFREAGEAREVANGAGLEGAAGNAEQLIAQLEEIRHEIDGDQACS